MTWFLSFPIAGLFILPTFFNAGQCTQAVQGTASVYWKVTLGSYESFSTKHVLLLKPRLCQPLKFLVLLFSKYMTQAHLQLPPHLDCQHWPVIFPSLQCYSWGHFPFLCLCLITYLLEFPEESNMTPVALLNQEILYIKSHCDTQISTDFFKHCRWSQHYQDAYRTGQRIETFVNVPEMCVYLGK